MGNLSPKAIRGRPKTLDRDHVLKVAMECYWKDGPTAVSINEICRRANVSKPSLYREFGNEDDFKSTVLSAYGEMVLSQMLKVLDRDQSFDVAISALTDLVLQDRQKLGIPMGCLFQKMRGCRKELGPRTNDVIDATWNSTQSKFRDWIERVKRNGQLNEDIPLATVAIYIDKQISSAMIMQEEGFSKKQISKFLDIAFRGLKSN